MRTTVPPTTRPAFTSPSSASSRVPSSTSSESLADQSPSPAKQKYSRPRQVVPGVPIMASLQFLKFWILPSFTPGSWM